MTIINVQTIIIYIIFTDFRAISVQKITKNKIITNLPGVFF